MNEHEGKRTVCPECGEDTTEFVQFASGDESTVATDTDEVGDGLLELRCCDNCGSGIEIVLEATKFRVIQHE